MVKWQHLGKWEKAVNKEPVGPNYWFCCWFDLKPWATGSLSASAIQAP